MARWSLRNPHYLNVPGTEVEFKEVSRESGKQARKVYEVPCFLNPNDPSDQNYREQGMIIVCHEGKGQPRDIVFVGEPTPDMEPLDDEAEAISKSLEKKWAHPIETLAANGEDYGAAIMKMFQKQIDQLGGIKPTPLPEGISVEDFKKVQQQLAELVAQNAALQEQLAEKAKPEVRR